MGLQSFKFATDFLNNLETPVIYVAKKDKTIVNSVSVYDGLRLTFNLNAFQTGEFKIYRDIDGKRQDYFNDFEEEMLILIPGIGWYEIHVETNIEQTGISKSITATSLECKLCDKRLIDFECNAGEILYDDYVRTIFYDPTNPKGSLLHRILNVAPNWHVGHVDASLASMQRTFDVDDTDVYSFLTGEVSEAFNCLFIFDTFNETVNAYDLDKYGTDTDIFVSMDNLAQNMTETIDQNSVITCYRVNGGDGVYINEVNPNGTNKLYNFEYYLPQMSSDIQTKVIAYNNKYQSLKPQYEDIMLRMQTQVDIIQELNTRLPDSLSSKDWTLYGLSFLESKQKSFKTQDELYCAQGMNKPESLSYNLYKQNLQDLNDVTAELSVRQGEIDSATVVYNSIKSERDALQEQLDMDNWFTVDEWKSLDNYVVEATYDNDNYIVTDLEDDSERFEIERQLYEVAWKDLSKKCRPQYQYSATLANVLTIPEFKDFIQYFELGNFIRMETDYDTIVKLRMISFSVDYTNTKTIDVTFSDAVRVHDVYDDAASIQAQANSAAMSFQFNKDQYDKTVKQGNFVAEMRKYGLDVATTAIHNSSNQVQTWDSTGLTFRQWNDERQDYDPEMAKIINNMMVFSDDSMQTVRMGIGKIFLPNGEYSYGINGETILGKLFLGQYLTLENDSGTYKFDDAGFSASNGVNTVKIQPNNSGELFSIYKGNKKNFYVDASGNLHFEGDLTGATGTFSGLVSGGSINIGNGTFTVDSNGNMYASSGTFGGQLNGATGSFSGELRAATGTFTGKLSSASMEGGTISGATIISTGSYGTTTISGGNIVTKASGDHVSCIRMSSGDYGVQIQPVGELLTCDKNGSVYQALSIYPWQMTMIDYESTLDGNVHHTDITAVGVESYIITVDGNLAFKNNAVTTGTSSGTTNYRLYKVGNPYGTGGNENIPTAGWVKGYVANNSPSVDTSNFASKNHSHSNYVSYASYSFSDSPTTKYAPRYFNVYGNTLSVSGLLISTSSSDKRLKDNIQPLRDIEDFYMHLNPVEYVWRDGYITTQKGLQFGLVAQDVENELREYGISNSGLVLKEIAEEDEKGIHGDDITYKLDKEQLHAMHIQMIQKQHNEIKLLKQEIKELKELIKK